VLRPKARAPAAGRPTRLAVQANVRLAHVKQNTQQKIASMQYKSGYLAYQPTDIVFLKASIVVGACSTAGSPVDVLIPIPSISATHAKLLGSKGEVLVQDLNSTNGTYIEGKLVDGSCVALPGQTISFDRELGIEFTVVIEEATAGLTPKQVGKAKEATYSGFTSEALMEERLKDRSAWVAKYNSRGGAAASGISSEAALGDRVKDRTEWIANYSAGGAAGGPMTSEASLTDRIEDRSAWIANYNSAGVSIEERFFKTASTLYV
jgi:pSer/pThr/pTyr-binding forkhead associated (FHA) protein